MPYIPDIRGPELPSGGVPILPPDLHGVAPIEVQLRVQAERDGVGYTRRDAEGRPQIAVPVAGFGVNLITLPAFAALDRVKAKELADKRAGRI